MGKKQNPVYDKAYQLYLDGLSLQQVANEIGVTRQCVYVAFKRRFFQLRGINFRPFQFYDGKKFTLRNTGYYSLTTDDRCLMHRYVWEKEKGKIPDNWDIHHLDEIRSHNYIDNLEAIDHKDHASIYATGNNQYGKGRRSVISKSIEGIIKKYSTTQEAANKIGGCRTGIVKAINGSLKTYKKLKWKYASN